LPYQEILNLFFYGDKLNLYKIEESLLSRKIE
jgi:hypothetical protein